MIRCGKCGRDNADGMRFCTNCGELLETAASGGSSSTAADPPSADTLSFSAPPPTSPTGWPTIGSFAPPPPAQPVDKGRGSNTGLIVGIIVVLLLGVAGAAGLIGWYLYSKPGTEVANINRKPENVNATPTPANANTRPSPEAKPSPSPRSFEPPTVPTKEGKFTVYANEGWQLSDIAVVPYENYTTRVDGIVDLAGAKAGIRAGGDKDAKLKPRRLFAEYPTGALLMRTRYADGRFSNTVAVMGPGTNGSWQNLPDERGFLEFAINDNDPQGNGGQFTISVKMTSVPKK
jgi:zinc-ribbon domain